MWTSELTDVGREEDVESELVRSRSATCIGLSANRGLVAGLRPRSAADWLLVAGDVGERLPDIEWALRTLSERFAGSSGAPGTTTCGRTHRPGTASR